MRGNTIFIQLTCSSNSRYRNTRMSGFDYVHNLNQKCGLECIKYIRRVYICSIYVNTYIGKTKNVPAGATVSD